jgi:hypothetical protein
VSDFTKSILYKLYLLEKEEIEKLKWIESEKVGQNIGNNKAVLIWIRRYRADWFKSIKDDLD